jgi:hypothetical protein
MGIGGLSEKAPCPIYCLICETRQQNLDQKCSILTKKVVRNMPVGGSRLGHSYYLG